MFLDRFSFAFSLWADSLFMLQVLPVVLFSCYTYYLSPSELETTLMSVRMQVWSHSQEKVSLA